MVFKKQSLHPGFTIVELLVVIVVIGVLAAITIVSYSGIQSRAQISKINEDLATLSKAIQLARVSTSQTFMQITGTGYTAGQCTGKAAGTDLAALPRSDSCWTRYLLDLSQITSASGINVNNIVDPWGRPYFIDENEGEGGGCSKDTLASYTQPFNGTSTQYAISIPLSGFSGCAI